MYSKLTASAAVSLYRNIIERTYPEECSDRRRSLLAEDEQMLSRFKSVRERESQLKDETIPNLRREEVRKLVVTLLCIFGTVLALLVRTPSLALPIYLSTI